MKKLLILAAFLGLSYVGVQAQTAAPAPAKQQPSATVQPSQKADVKVDVVDADLTDKEEKKSESHKKGSGCSEQKSCDKKSGKKACCSEKKQSKGTPANQ
jgi:hypothetical protein